MEDHVSDDSRRLYFTAADVHREPKAWGEEQWVVNKDYCGKKLYIRKDRRCSMHSHEEKDEVLLLESGRVVMELDGESFTLDPGDFVHVRPGTAHRFTALEDSVMTEFSTTHRNEDSYRTEPSGHLEAMRYERQCSLIDSFGDISGLVVGDAMVDTYQAGSVDRISPEAPVPVVRLYETVHSAGGAGNAARNMASLGARTTIVSVCGDDAAGKTLADLFEQHGVEAVLEVDRSRPTTEKRRVTTLTGQQLIRVDIEETSRLDPALEDRLLDQVRANVTGRDVFVVSDYAKGVVSTSLLKECVSVGREAGVPVVLAPKPESSDYLPAARGAAVLVANRFEATALTRSAMDEPATDLARKLAEWVDAGAIVTMAERGMAVCDGDDVFVLPARAERAVDVSGAGDSVTATVAVAFAAGATLLEAADLATRAAAVVVGKPGTATVDRSELHLAL